MKTITQLVRSATTAVVVALTCFFGLSQQANAQQSCDGAMAITAGTYTIASINGTNLSGECSTASMAKWYAYTPSQNYSLTVTSDLAANICKDTNFNVYTGTCGSLTCYTGDDDSGTLQCNSGNSNSYLSTKTFDVFAGTTYYIAWDNKWSAAGFQFQVTEAPFISNPCSLAITATAGLTTVPEITGSTIALSCSSGTLAAWYKYTPSSNLHVTISSDLPQNICNDTNFSIYTGSCSATMTCVGSDDNSGVINCSGTTISNLSVKTIDVNGGTTYYIVWDNKWSAQGFDFTITETPIVAPISYIAQTISSVNSAYNKCIVDINGDGLDDLVGVSQNNLRANIQTASGTFTVIDFPISGSSAMPSWSLAAGDYNRDGYNDLVLGSGSGLTFWKSNATGTAYTRDNPGEYIFCQRTNFVDINNDGNLDAFSCHDVAPNVYYLNNGSGVFTYYQSTITPGAYSLGATASGGNYASIWTDIDNDGDVDMFMSKCSGPPSELHRNDGNGVFTDISIGSNLNFTPVTSWSSAVADFDNDGDMDILVGSNGGVGSKLFRNNLSGGVLGAFTNVTTGSGWDTQNTTNRDYIAYDFDNDGFVDIMGGGNRIMFNNGDMTFSATNYPNLQIGAVGDLNNDGFLDVQNGSTVWFAQPNGNKYITVNLTGVQSNRNGIGARVEIYGAWGKQIRDIRSGEGFGFMSTLLAHFGIGSATQIDAVIIRWPSGTVDAVMNPAVNQTLNVVEGSSPLGVNTVGKVGFAIYPNPTTDLLHVQLDANLDGISTMEIYDISGKLVSSPKVENNEISVKNLSSGTYMLLLESNSGQRVTQKFIKQ